MLVEYKVLPLKYFLNYRLNHSWELFLIIPESDPIKTGFQPGILFKKDF